MSRRIEKREVYTAEVRYLQMLQQRMLLDSRLTRLEAEGAIEHLNEVIGTLNSVTLVARRGNREEKEKATQ